MRKLLENMSWSVVDDILYCHSPEIFETEIILRPYGEATRLWFEWASKSQPNESKKINRLSELESKVRRSVPETYKLEGGMFVNQLFENLTYPILIALTPSSLIEKIPDYVISFDSKKIIEAALNDLNKLEKIVPGTTEAIVQLITKRTADKESLVPKYPSNDFVLALFEKFTNINVTDLYDDYSSFIHSYSTSWQIFPSSSILEFRVFSHEIEKFSKVLLGSLDALTKTALRTETKKARVLGKGQF